MLGMKLQILFLENKIASSILSCFYLKKQGKKQLFSSIIKLFCVAYSSYFIFIDFRYWKICPR